MVKQYNFYILKKKCICIHGLLISERKKEQDYLYTSKLGLNSLIEPPNSIHIY